MLSFNRNLLNETFSVIFKHCDYEYGRKKRIFDKVQSVVIVTNTARYAAVSQFLSSRIFFARPLSAVALVPDVQGPLSFRLLQRLRCTRTRDVT